MCSVNRIVYVTSVKHPKAKGTKAKMIDNESFH